MSEQPQGPGLMSADSLWDTFHTHYWYHNAWYYVTELAPGEYRANVMGQERTGRTPDEAIQNAARLHLPQPTDESED